MGRRFRRRSYTRGINARGNGYITYKGVKGYKMNGVIYASKREALKYNRK